MRIAVVRQHVDFVFALARINEEEKSAIVILHARQKIRFPFSLL